MDVQHIFKAFLETGTNDSMHRVIAVAKTGEVTDEDLAFFATGLADSGDRFPDSGPAAADVASTGGPSSLSTLLCPLFLLDMEHRVPKLAVPGRPAGGVDVLAQIPGYRVNLSTPDVLNALDSCGYAHFLATKRHTPRDAQLFAFRKQHGAVAVPELAIASLLSKKLAVGLTNAGLDVRVAPHGNFGNTWHDARRNAERLCRVGAILGMKVKCFLTDGRFPYQPYIGRGESLLAIAAILDSDVPPWLSRHVRKCFAMSKAVANPPCNGIPSGGRLAELMDSNLRAQGSSLDSFGEHVNAIGRQPRFELTAYTSGFLAVSLSGLREILTDLQEKATTDTDFFPDPVGLILMAEPGEYVVRGEPIARVRCVPEIWEHLCAKLWNRAFGVVDSPGESAAFEEVSCA